MLTAWFHLNTKDFSAKQYVYTEFPHHNVYNSNKRQWKTCQRHHKIVSHMYSVNPKDEKRFFLRLLLLHVPGATNYDELKTVDGITMTTYKEACKARNLLEDDNAWHQALEEAALLKMPHQ